MKKPLLIILSVLVILLAIVAVAKFRFPTNPTKTASNKIDFKNASYLIDDESVTLTNGRAEESIAPDSATKQIVQYFGNELKADFNHDGYDDVVFFLTKDSGGSGTFFYVALALGGPTGYAGANTIFLGDRIAPQTINLDSDLIAVNYADRKSNEPFSVSPSVGFTKYFAVQDGRLVETTKK